LTFVDENAFFETELPAVLLKLSLFVDHSVDEENHQGRRFQKDVLSLSFNHASLYILILTLGVTKSKVKRLHD